MKIMFVYSVEDAQSISKPLQSWSDMQFGISCISSVLKAGGHQTKLVVAGANNPWHKSFSLINKTIAEFTPRLICFSPVVSQYNFIKKVAASLKAEWPDIFLIAGGVHATLNPSEVIEASFDALCVGEGEYPLLELCAQLEAGQTPHKIPNLWIKSPDGGIEKNQPRSFIKDLDSLPFPDREMWRPWIKEQPGAELAVLLGRGCPYNCTYCCNHVLKKVTDGKYVRFRSPENIIKEIAAVHAEFFDKSKMYFEVESIALDKEWLFEFCRQLEVFNATIDNSISYGCNFRISPQSKDEKIFSALKKANFNKINIGLESGSERVRKEVLNRNYSNEDFLDVVGMARKAGFSVFVFNIIGLPKETYDDYLQTVSLNRQCQPDMHYTGIFFPYPGTKLHELCVSEGFLNDGIDYRLERRKPVIDIPGFSKRRVSKEHIWFDYRVYRGHRPLYWILMRTVMNKIRSVSILNSLCRRMAQLKALTYIREKMIKI